MIEIPYTQGESTTPALEDGTHLVRLTDIKFIKKNGKLLLTYTGTTGEYLDWLGFDTDPQAKRTYAYLCRLHELAGLPVPKGSSFDEAALLARLPEISITVYTNEKGYKALSEFPAAAGAGAVSDDFSGF